MSEKLTACKDCKHYLDRLDRGYVITLGHFCGHDVGAQKVFDPYEARFREARAEARPCSKVNTDGHCKLFAPKDSKNAP